MRHRANMVFMTMRQYQCQQVFTLLFNKAGICRNQVNARRIRLAECHAQIDHNPVARTGAAIAVKIAIHPNLARAAQGQKNQTFFLFSHFCPQSERRHHRLR